MTNKNLSDFQKQMQERGWNIHPQGDAVYRRCDNTIFMLKQTDSPLATSTGICEHDLERYEIKENSQRTEVETEKVHSSVEEVLQTVLYRMFGH